MQERAIRATGLGAVAVALASAVLLTPVAGEAQGWGSEPKGFGKGSSIVDEPAAPPLHHAMTGPKMVEFLQNWGLRAELTTDSYGDPLIRSSTSGATFSVWFFDCDTAPEKSCSSIQYASAWDLQNGVTHEVINNWNRKRRYLRAYLDDEMDPFVEMDIKLDGGVSEDNLRAWMNMWERALGEFKNEVLPK